MFPHPAPRQCPMSPPLPPVFNVPSPPPRRFLRKPNVSEAAEEFGRLAGRLTQAELPEYAGLTQLARARCQETLANKTGETDALLAAARQFLQAHHEHTDLACPTPGSQLQAAVSLYNAAIRQQLAAQRGLLAARTCLELGHALRRLGRLRQALLYFQVPPTGPPQQPLWQESDVASLAGV